MLNIYAKYIYQNSIYKRIAIFGCENIVSGYWMSLYSVHFVVYVVHYTIYSVHILNYCILHISTTFLLYYPRIFDTCDKYLFISNIIILY